MFVKALRSQKAQPVVVNISKAHITLRPTLENMQPLSKQISNPAQ